MNENVNLCEILKDCPKRTKFYSPLFGEVTFLGISDNVNDAFPIMSEERGNIRTFTSDGKYDPFNKECLLLPSKEQRDWRKFSAPWYKKERFNPKTLQPFDKVLVRNSRKTWRCEHFSYFKEGDAYPYMTSTSYAFCIPYNNDTKHLVGTDDEAPEFYRYWED